MLKNPKKTQLESVLRKIANNSIKLMIFESKADALVVLLLILSTCSNIDFHVNDLRPYFKFSTYGTG